MKYFLDTEFHEYKKKPFLGRAVNTIELISIGIVSEEGKEYYAICNEFDVKEAFKNKWLRENVLEPIRHEYVTSKSGDQRNMAMSVYPPTLRGYKRIFKLLGKSKKQIAEEVIRFISDGWVTKDLKDNITGIGPFTENPEFYAYYADYDWVVFCWLFGRMIDLPKGFPMYCKDLKQELDEVLHNKNWYYVTHTESTATNLTDFMYVPTHQLDRHATLQEKLNKCKTFDEYPAQENEHNALDDAKWNKKLHEFITKL